jgi:hypothetical protein
MSRKLIVSILVFVLFLGTVFVLFTGCTSKTSLSPSPIQSTSPTPGGAGGAVINSDSIITADIKTIQKLTGGFGWELDILVKTSEAVGSLPNPVADKTNQTVTVKSNEDLSSFKVGQSISGKIKYVGDVPKPGITLLLYNVTAQK